MDPSRSDNRSSNYLPGKISIWLLYTCQHISDCVSLHSYKIECKGKRMRASVQITVVIFLTYIHNEPYVFLRRKKNVCLFVDVVPFFFFLFFFSWFCVCFCFCFVKFTFYLLPDSTFLWQGPAINPIVQNDGDEPLPSLSDWHDYEPNLEFDDTELTHPATTNGK